MPTLKRFFSAVAIVVAIFGFAVPADAVVLNNGVVAVRNLTSHTIHISFIQAVATGDYMHYRGGNNISPGKTWYSDWCCIMAGTVYVLSYSNSDKPNEMLRRNFNPYLCNHNGIPYGSVEITIADHYSNSSSRWCYAG